MHVGRPKHRNSYLSFDNMHIVSEASQVSEKTTICLPEKIDFTNLNAFSRIKMKEVRLLCIGSLKPFFSCNVRVVHLFLPILLILGLTFYQNFIGACLL